ncbi:hypothetical protein Pint_24867 [Pistacia integerrima]|uniref:Uncharacterized protein n=1 Tax=Pistacia integerrima TaxID=434235 RepID=A0ACC0YC98_9ROSI|nr:hypothetical protein Pint_24867 [Pistacia integerrima]
MAGTKEERCVLASEILFDISKGRRTFLEAEEAEEILRPLKEPGNSFAKMCFSNRSFGRPEAEALEVMNIFSAALEGGNLKSLILSNNALGEKGVHCGDEGGLAISEVVNHSPLSEDFRCTSTMIGSKGGIALHAYLTEVYQSYLNLEDKATIAIANALWKSTPLLEVLELAGNEFIADATAAIFACIQVKQHLTKLNSAETEIVDEVALYN